MKRLTLKNKIAVVTGGCGFFGSQICDALLELKCKVILLDIDKKKIDASKKKLRKKKC